MYQSILEAFGLPQADIPRFKKPAFEAIVDLAREKNAPIFLDEADLIGPRLLESVRDLCKLTMTPWVLIGEESLSRLMNRNRRIWSRRCATLTFAPMAARDIIAFAREACKLKLTGDAAPLIAHKTDGDIRLIELTLSSAEIIAQANTTTTVDVAIAKAALAQVIPEVIQ